MLLGLGGRRGRRRGLGLRHRVLALLRVLVLNPGPELFLALLRPPRIDRRWPSNTVVSQWRSFSARPAQSFAAAAALISGPAPRRSCMPRPVLPSLIMMIGRSAAISGLDLVSAAPERAQAVERVGAAEIDRKARLLDRDCGGLASVASGGLAGAAATSVGSGRRLGFLLGAFSRRPAESVSRLPDQAAP